MCLVWREFCGRRVLSALWNYYVLSVCMCACVSVLVHSPGDQTAMGAASILLVLESKLGSSDWAVSAFILWAIMPACCWVFNVTLLVKSNHSSSSLILLRKDNISLRRMSRNSPSSGSLDSYRKLWLFRIHLLPTFQMLTIVWLTWG